MEIVLRYRMSGFYPGTANSRQNTAQYTQSKKTHAFFVHHKRRGFVQAQNFIGNQHLYNKTENSSQQQGTHKCVRNKNLHNPPTENIPYAALGFR